MQPSLSIGIHAIVEVGLDSQVNVEPGYEGYQCISQARDMLSLEENGTVELYNIAIEDKSIYCSVRLHAVKSSSPISANGISSRKQRFMQGRHFELPRTMLSLCTVFTTLTVYVTSHTYCLEVSNGGQQMV